MDKLMTRDFGLLTDAVSNAHEMILINYHSAGPYASLTLNRMQIEVLLRHLQERERDEHQSCPDDNRPAEPGDLASAPHLRRILPYG